MHQQFNSETPERKAPLYFQAHVATMGADRPFFMLDSEKISPTLPFARKGRGRQVLKRKAG
jgi:hypothetical protein